MKAITIKQPWASLICEGIKDIENRTWRTNYRGRVMIHASAKPAIEFKNFCLVGLYRIGMTEEMILCASKNLFDIKNSLTYNSLIIGSVEIVDCVINHSSVWAEKTSVNRMPSQPIIYNWVLANPILFKEPLPAKGKQSFWESECEILVCPQCSGHCLHDNHDIGMPNWGNPVHECEHCGYMILESEFEKLK